MNEITIKKILKDLKSDDTKAKALAAHDICTGYSRTNADEKEYYGQLQSALGYALNDSNSEVRYNAARALMLMYSEEEPSTRDENGNEHYGNLSMMKMNSLLTHIDAYIQLGALEYLSHLAAYECNISDFVDILIRMLVSKKGDDRVKLAAFTALKYFAGQFKKKARMVLDSLEKSKAKKYDNLVKKLITICNQEIATP